jgi:hypothetical protein
MRFGMFAETFHNTPQQELFSIEISSKEGKTEPYSMRQKGLTDSQLNYLTRRYYYAHQLSDLADHLKTSPQLRTNEKIVIVRNVFEKDHWTKQTLLTK